MDSENADSTPNTSDPVRRHRAWIDSIPEALTPYYHQARPNEDIGLYRGPVILTRESGSYPMSGLVKLSWLPRPRIECTATGKMQMEDKIAEFFRGRERDLALPADLKIVPRQLKSLRFRARHEPGTTSMMGGIAPPPFETPEARLTHVVFHVVNFSDLRGSTIRRDQSLDHGRIIFDDPEWLIVLDSRYGDPKFKTALGRHGGYGITHTGRLQRRDDREFTGHAVQDLLESLLYYLWLGKGSVCAPVLPVGFDESGKAGWANWTLPFLDPITPPLGWLDGHYANAYAASFSSFRAKWADDYWREVLRLALRYYLKANEPDPVQAGIVMGQIALELLSWAVLAVDGRKLSKRAWRKLSAEEVIRQLLHHFQIPADMPPHLSTLAATSAKHKWKDGPHAIVALRNEVVHLKRPRADYPFKAWIEGWLLTTYYVELSLLALIGYQGEYNSRLNEERWVGAVEPVPWARNVS